MKASNIELIMDQNQNQSLHTGVTKDTASTPGYFRMFVPGMMVRYIPRSIFGALKEASAIEDNGGPSFTRLEKKIKGQWSPIQNYVDAVSAGQATEGMKEKAIRSLRGFNPFAREGTLEKVLQDVPDSEKKFTKGMRTRFWDAGYDNSLGIGSLALTTLYAMRVKSDMRSVFAETVAYEQGKKPSDITFMDLARSDNAIVSHTVHNYVMKNIGRYATDLVFFGRYLAKIPGLNWMRVMPFGDAGVGIKGAVLLNEVVAKKNTIFEDLVQLIDKKLNPIKGIGEPITASDMIDLYQKYAMQHNPEAAFKDATIRQRRDGIDWDKAKPLFSRIADLMNQTYKYKHSTLDHVSYEERELAATSDLALPKFLYLLGHGLIDPRRPEESLTYVELANRHGIEAVKTVCRGIEQGTAFREAIKPYGLDPRVPVMAEPVSAAAAVSAPTRENSPDTQVSDMAVAQRLQDAAQQAAVLS